jgi:ubiquinone/menaquinone biosynthesis C-methylase UbiE
MDWHARYTQQAGWTAQMRAYLFEQAGVKQARRLLEVGCGTGAVLADFARRDGLHGLDIDPNALSQSSRNVPGAALTCADGARLPYRAGAFDAVFCHFTLLWMHNPLEAVREMRRVTCTGGAVLALAEPDYGGRVDYPPELAELGGWQGTALKQQGADPGMGRKLAQVFSQAGLRRVAGGVIGGQWQGAPPRSERDLEWQTLQYDLAGQVSVAQLEKMRALEESAWAEGSRVLFVPTFYAWGVV